jgi:2-polyprenyl-3-methyl-5-hydroxy-6-metoxy-1,4-benzoquinol methylase
MSNYIDYLKKISSPQSFQRKHDYFKYNYEKLIFPKHNQTKSILEIGPGLGEFVSYLNSKGFNNIDIVDNDESILVYNKSKYKINTTFKANRLIAIEKDLSSYDAIVLTQVLEHIPKSQYKEFLTVLYDHLKNDGTIIITVPNMGNPFTTCELYADLTHQNGFTNISLIELVSTCKLKNVTASVRNFKIPPYSVTNLVRIVLQKLLHGIILISSIINGGTYSKFLTPNITLIIKK